MKTLHAIPCWLQMCLAHSLGFHYFTTTTTAATFAADASVAFVAHTFRARLVLFQSLQLKMKRSKRMSQITQQRKKKFSRK